MESLIINQKKLQAIIFTAFSHSRANVYCDITKEHLQWTHGGTGHVRTMVRNAYGLEQHKYYYTHARLIESMNHDDLIEYLGREWKKFEEAVNDIEIQKKGAAETTSEVVGQNSADSDSVRLCAAANHLIEYMAERYHPHCTAIVTSNSVEVVEGIINVPNIDMRRK